MRLKQYLTEGRSKKISSIEVRNLLNTKCKKAFKMFKEGIVIYRGVKNVTDSYVLVTPSKFTRKSLNTYNYYTLINDNSPAWKDYPKRSKSIICTTNQNTARSFGELYAVFPFDGAKIGVCPDVDYWTSFLFLDIKTDISNMMEFNEQLKYLFDIQQIKRFAGDISKANTYKDLQKLFYKFDKFIKIQDEKTIKEMKQKSERNNIDFVMPDKSPTIQKIIKEHDVNLLKKYDDFMNMEKYFRYLLDPEKNYFGLKRVGDKLPNDVEVWTDGDSVLIKYFMLDDLSL